MTRRSIAGAAALTAAFLFAGCATPRPYEPRYITVYDCSETLETADGRFRVDETFLHWTRELGDGVTVSTSLSLFSPGVRANFADRGFSGYAEGMPRFLVHYGAGHGERTRWRNGTPHFEVASDTRLGEWSMRAWLTTDGYQVVPWPDVANWLTWDRSEAFVFTLYDATGTRLQGATLPRVGFARAERTLQDMHVRAMERFASRETLCRSERQEEGEEIVVT